ncbi:MAG: hypothetical protein NVSMB19_21880 [Vulcanimicrobiaceae bacterium]
MRIALRRCTGDAERRAARTETKKSGSCSKLTDYELSFYSRFAELLPGPDNIAFVRQLREAVVRSREPSEVGVRVPASIDPIRSVEESSVFDGYYDDRDGVENGVVNVIVRLAGGRAAYIEHVRHDGAIHDMTPLPSKLRFTFRPER